MKSEDELRGRHDIVWHYTSGDVFAKIMEGETRLYATHYKFLNDGKEFEYKKEYFNTKLFPIVNRLIDDEIKKAINSESKEEWNNLRKKWEDSLIGHDDMYTFCLSKKPDNLYHWRAYTPNGGYCIGFSKESIRKRICTTEERDFDGHIIYKNRIDSGDSYDIFMDDCIYENRESTVESISGLLLKMSINKDVDNTRILVHSALTKHDSFKDEDEFRVVLIGQSLRKKIEVIANKHRVPIFDNKTDEICDLIEGVFVSPHGNKERNKLFAELLAKKHGCEGKWSVYLSDSPYIGDY